MGKRERVLSAAEQKRKAAFEKICGAMTAEGYRRKDLTVGIVQANVAAIAVMLPFAAAAVLLYFYRNPLDGLHLSFAWGGYFAFLLGMVLLIVLHEVIHGLVWGFFAKSHWKAIHFGVIWEALTPYCTCAEPLTKWQYILGAAAPTLLLGFIPAAAAAVLGSFWLLALAVVMIFGGGGDFFIILKLLCCRFQTKEVLFYDHPYECGLVAFEKL